MKMSVPFEKGGYHTAGKRLRPVGCCLFLIVMALILLSGCAEIRIQPIEDTPTPVTPTPTEIPTFTPVPTNTIVWFPPTVTPRPMRTPVIVPTVSQLPQTGAVLYSDDFSTDENWQTYRSPMGNAVIANNEITLAIQNADSGIASYSSLPQLGDYYMSMDVSLSLCSWNGDWYAIAFRVADSENQYRWVFNCLGQSRVERVYKGRIYVLEDWDINGAVKPSAPQKFSVGIAAQGPVLRFYANGALLITVEDTVFTGGGYGLVAASDGYSPLTVSFSNFRLTEIYYSEPEEESETGPVLGG